MHGVILLLHLCLLVSATLLYGDDRKKAIFKEISDDASLEDGSMTSMFHKIFHQCSIEEDCSFVVKNLEKDEFKKFYNEKDLPKDRKGFRLWQKHQSLSTKLPEVQEVANKKEIMVAPSMLRDRRVTRKITVLSNGKPTSQSSNAYGNVSIHGVDGRTDRCFTTRYGTTGTWWMVDLVKKAMVIQVAISSTANIYPLRDFNIRVGNQKASSSNPLCLEHARITVPQFTQIFECNYPIRGRYLYIETHWRIATSFSICEVKVYGYYW